MENPIIIYEDNHVIVALKPQNMPSCDDESKDLSLLSAHSMFSFLRIA